MEAKYALLALLPQVYLAFACQIYDIIQQNWNYLPHHCAGDKNGTSM